MKITYEEYSIDATFYTLKGFFFFYMPLRVPYAKLEQAAKDAGYTIKNKQIIEKGKAFGNGWIGIEVESAKEQDQNVVQIKGDFKATKHIGSYRQLSSVFKQVMQDHPEAKEFYSVYLNTPMEVEQDKLETLVVFR